MAPSWHSAVRKEPWSALGAGTSGSRQRAKRFAGMTSSPAEPCLHRAQEEADTCSHALLAASGCLCLGQGKPRCRKRAAEAQLTSVSSVRPKDDLALPRPEPARLARTGSSSGRPPKAPSRATSPWPAAAAAMWRSLRPPRHPPPPRAGRTLRTWTLPAPRPGADLGRGAPGVSSASRLRGWAKGRRGAGCSGSKMKGPGRREGFQSRAPQLPDLCRPPFQILGTQAIK